MCIPTSNVRHPALLTAAALVGFASLARAGDFNGDGIDDLAIGVPGENVNNLTAGAVAVFYGTRTAGLSATAIPDQVFSQALIGVGVQEAGDRFGAALASGDFNGDGVDDLAIGNPMEDATPGFVGIGSVTILFGRGVNPSGRPSGLTTVGARLLVPDRRVAMQFGAALAADDFDGDGFADLAIGAPSDGIGGSVQVLYGPDFTNTRRQVWTQDSAGIDDRAELLDSFGAALAAADLIADGTADLAIGVPGENLGGGMVHVLIGFPGVGLSAAGSRTIVQGLDGLAGGQAGNDRFGAALAACPGTRSPLAIGCPRDQDSPVRSGSVLFLPHGLSTTQSTFISQQSVAGLAAPTPQDGFGSSLALHDFGRFSLPAPAFDLAIGAPGATVSTPTLQVPNAGVVFVLYGRSATTLDLQGAVRLAQGVNGLGDVAETGDLFGRALAAGDFGRDPLGDLVVGAPGEDAGLLPNTGAVHVIYGSTVAGLSTTNNQTWTQDAPNVDEQCEPGDSFGASVSGR